MVGPLFFLAGAGLFTFLATVSSRRTRRRDLSLRLRLEKANEELKELDEAKTRFFANVSHELRTPLTLLLGPLETLLGAEEETAERRVLLESMAANARRLLRQVNALLEGAKLESGRLRLEPAAGQPGRGCWPISPPPRRRTPSGGGCGCAPSGWTRSPTPLFDGHKAEIIAANLLSNALKFTPSGGTVTVRAEAEPDGVAFTVEDDGPGIPEDQLERIFERFHQVDGFAPRASRAAPAWGSRSPASWPGFTAATSPCAAASGPGAAFRVELPRDPGVALVERRRASAPPRGPARPGAVGRPGGPRVRPALDARDAARRRRPAAPGERGAAPAAAGRRCRASCWSRTTLTCAASSPPAWRAATGWRPPPTAPPASRRRGGGAPTWWSPT